MKHTVGTAPNPYVGMVTLSLACICLVLQVSALGLYFSGTVCSLPPPTSPHALPTADMPAYPPPLPCLPADSPFRLRNRHNEVWILAAAAPSHHTAAAGQQSVGSWLQKVFGKRAGPWGVATA